PSASGPLAHNEAVKVHIGTAEVMARVSLLEGAVLDPGASAWAQLRLAEPVALAVGDRFVLRRPSPSETLGGGMVADVSGERMRRRREAVPLGDALVGREGFDALATRVERGLAAAHRRSPLRAGVPREEVRSSLGLAPKRFNALVDRLSRDGRLVEHGSALALPGHVVALTTAQEKAWSHARDELGRQPLQPPSPQTLEQDF